MFRSLEKKVRQSTLKELVGLFVELPDELEAFQLLSTV